MDHNRTKPTSNADLMSSAKILADAAKSALNHDSAKIDKAAVAGASATVLGAAKKYGKLEEKSFGKYVDKAETYLHKYNSSSSNSPPAAHGGPHGSVSGGGGGGGGGGGHGHSSSGGGGGSGGAGEYIKLAQGLLKKGEHGGDGGGHGHSSGGGGGSSGDYIKLAQGLLKKH